MIGWNMTKDIETQFRESQIELERLRELKDPVTFFNFVNNVYIPIQHQWEKDSRIKLINATRDVYNKTGKCTHVYEYIYGHNHNSRFQDTKCCICGDINYYGGDD